MKQFISYPEIKQFRNVISNIKHQAQYLGKDEDGNILMDSNAKMPVLRALGTVKIHGTNSGVAYNDLDGIWAQSRNDVITVDKDNAGFAFFVESKKKAFKSIMDQIIKNNNIDPTENTIVLFGEWAGPGIQKGMGITQLPEKSMFIFGIKVKPFNEKLDSYWLECKGYKSIEDRIYNINDYQIFEVEIDFNDPRLAQTEMINLMLKVEEECPVARALGYSGLGEGIVFTINYKGSIQKFKIKGEKHAKGNKIKKPKIVDDEKLNKINEVVVKVLPLWRLDQMYTQVMNLMNGGQPDIKKTGDFLRAVVQDVYKEDIDIIIDSGLEPKEVNGTISSMAKKWLFDKLDGEVGL